MATIADSADGATVDALPGMPGRCGVCGRLAYDLGPSSITVYAPKARPVPYQTRRVEACKSCRGR